MKLYLATKTVIYSLVILCNFASVSVSAESLLDEGKQLYEAKHFEKARQYLEAEIKVNPKDATAHYLLGNIFLELKQTNNAQKEYQEAQQLDSNGPAGQYSRLALSEIDGKSLVSSTATTVRIKSRSAKIDSANVISSEVNNSVKQQQSECDAKVKAMLAQSASDINRLNSELQQKIAENGPPQFSVVYVPSGRGFRANVVQTYDPEPANQALREDYAASIDQIKERTQRQAKEVIESYKQKQLALEDSALTLEKSYTDNKLNRNVVLNPKGTDIYNRNYQTGDTPSGAPVPIKLAPAKSLPGLHANN